MLDVESTRYHCSCTLGHHTRADTPSATHTYCASIHVSICLWLFFFTYSLTQLKHTWVEKWGEDTCSAHINKHRKSFKAVILTDRAFMSLLDWHIDCVKTAEGCNWDVKVNTKHSLKPFRLYTCSVIIIQVLLTPLATPPGLSISAHICINRLRSIRSATINNDSVISVRLGRLPRVNAYVLRYVSIYCRLYLCSSAVLCRGKTLINKAKTMQGNCRCLKQWCRNLLTAYFIRDICSIAHECNYLISQTHGSTLMPSGM